MSRHRQHRNAHAPPTRRLHTVFLFTLAFLGCKPAEEPPRHASEDVLGGVSSHDIGLPSGAVRVTERIPGHMGGHVGGPVEAAAVAPTAPPLIGGVAPLTRPDQDAAAPGGDDAGEPGDVASAQADDATNARDAGPFPVRPEALPRSLLESLRAGTEGSAREDARRLNKLGLDAHKKLQLDVAKDHYIAALEAFPAYPFARYNLACALALQKRNDEALFHLAVLAHLATVENDEVSHDRLSAARIDADFELLRDDPRFRALTGSTSLQVAWAAGDAASASREEAQRLVKLLRGARWPARLADIAWQPAVHGSVIRVAGDDPIAEATAKEVAELLLEDSADASPRAWPIEIGAPLPPEAPPIVVIVAPLRGEATLAVPEAMPDTGSAPGFTNVHDAIGKRLRASRSASTGVEHHQLELKSTGFFAWELSRADGFRQTRTGRWSGGDTRIVLRVAKQTTETPSAADPATPAILVEDGLARDHEAAVSGDGLRIDDLLFR